MRNRLWITTGVLLGLGGVLRADYERPGPGPDLDAPGVQQGERAWSLWIRAFAGYNDNVQFLSDDNPFFAGEMESAYLGMTVEGSYRFWEQGAWQAGAAVRLDQTFHLEGAESPSGLGWTNEPSNFDLTVVEPALYLNYRSEEGAMPVYGRAVYSFRWEDTEDSAIGLTSHNVGFTVGVEPRADLHAELSYRHGWDDFDAPGPIPSSDRDADRDRVSLALIHPGSDSTPRMILQYSFLNNDADGSNYAYDGYEVMFRVESQLLDDVAGAFQVSYGELDYDTSVPGAVRKEHEIFKAGVQLVWVLDEQWSADCYYNYWNIDADTAIWESERNDVGIGLRYTF